MPRINERLAIAGIPPQSDLNALTDLGLSQFKKSLKQRTKDEAVALGERPVAKTNPF